MGLAPYLQKWCPVSKEAELIALDRGAIAKRFQVILMPTLSRSTGKGDLCRPALPSVLLVVVPFREGHHFNAREHAVLDGDRLDFAGGVIGVDEDNAASIPVIRAPFFAGFDIQFQCLSSHCLILAMTCFDEHGFCGHSGDVSGYFVSRCKAGRARLRKIAVEAPDLLPDRERHFRLLAYVHLEETPGARIFLGDGLESV